MSDKKIMLSPSGKYRLILNLTVKHEGYWQFTIAKVENAITDEFITVVHRNYPSFPHAWIEKHPDGHDYFVCGEDYQGQTVIQLDTGLRKDHLPQAVKKGCGFCWAQIEAEMVNGNPTLLVNGCYWGASFEYVRYDFASPFSLPYLELERWEEESEDWEDEE